MRHQPRQHQPGSDGEHALQRSAGTVERAHHFYDEQVHDTLQPWMCAFIPAQQMMWVASHDIQGNCDVTFRAGPPGFVQIIDDRRVAWPEYLGNGVMATMGNITETGQVGLLLLDFFEQHIGLHINGRATLFSDTDMRNRYSDLPELEGTRRLMQWVLVKIDEAYVHCSKNIPRLPRASLTTASHSRVRT